MGKTKARFRRKPSHRKKQNTQSTSSNSATDSAEMVSSEATSGEESKQSSSLPKTKYLRVERRKRSGEKLSKEELKERKKPVDMATALSIIEEINENQDAIIAAKLEKEKVKQEIMEQRKQKREEKKKKKQELLKQAAQMYIAKKKQGKQQDTSSSEAKVGNTKKRKVSFQDAPEAKRKKLHDSKA